MFATIFGFLSNGLAVLNKLLPSWEWEAADDRAKIDAVPAPSERDVVERLRKQGF